MNQPEPGRRHFLSAVALLTAGTSPAVRSQPAARVRRLGYMGNLSPKTTESRAVIAAFVSELNNLGWTQGSNLAIQFRFADGAVANFRPMLRELIDSRVDLIAAMTTAAAQVAKSVTSSIPIVFVAAEPVEYGLVATLGHPGGNLTGMALAIDELLGKRMHLLKNAVRGITRIGYLGMGETKSVAVARAAARALDCVLVPVDITSPEDFASISTTGPDVDAWLIDEYPMFTAHRAKIIDLMALQRKPAMYSSTAWVREGGLLAYSEDSMDVWRRAARYVDRILRGAEPANMPVEQASRFSFAVNMKLARSMALTINNELLLQADVVIR